MCGGFLKRCCWRRLPGEEELYLTKQEPQTAGRVGVLGPVSLHNHLWDGQRSGGRMETEGGVTFRGRHRMSQGASFESIVLGLNLGQAS